MFRGLRISALLATGLYLLAVLIPSLGTAGIITQPRLRLFGAAHQGSNAPSDFLWIDPNNGSASAIGPIGFNSVGAMDFDPRTGILYATGKRPADGEPVLITINRFSGEGAEVGPLVNIAGGNAMDISFGNTDGVLYLTSLGSIGVSLFSVDTTTGMATEVGDTTTFGPGNGLALDGVDNGYLVNSNLGGALFSVDSASGVATPLAQLDYLGFPPLNNPRINAMELAPGINFVSVNDNVIPRPEDGIGGGGPNYLGVINVRDELFLGPGSSETGEAEGGSVLGQVTNLGQSANGLDALAALPAPRLFGAAHIGFGSPSTLYSLNAFAGTATPIGPIGFNSVSGMDFDPFSGVLYGTGLRPFDDEKVLIIIDPLTGEGVEVGPLVNNLGNNTFDIAFRNSDGTLFASGIGDACVELFTIDTATGMATPVGPTITCDASNGLAMSLEDTLYHANVTANGTLYTVNQETGESTALTRLNFLGPPLQGPRLNAMEFVPGFNFVSINDGSGMPPGGGIVGGPNYLGIVFLEESSPGAFTDEGIPVAPLTGDVFIAGQTVDGLDAIAAMPASFVYGSAYADALDFASTLYRIDPVNGAYNAVGPIGFDMVNGLDFEPGSGKLFGIGQRPGDGTQVTIKVDPITGQGFEVGPLVNASFGPNDHDLSFRQGDGRLFSAAFGSTCIDLFSINTTSGQANEIGSTFTCAPSNALGFDVHDNLFHTDGGGAGPPPGNAGGGFGFLNQLDPSTGAGVTVAPLNYFNFPLLNFPAIDAMELTPGLQLVSVNDDTGGPGDGVPPTNTDYLATIITSDSMLPPPGADPEGAPPNFAGVVTFIGQTVPFLNSIATVTGATDVEITSEELFADGFETGDTSKWTNTTPSP